MDTLLSNIIKALNNEDKDSFRTNVLNALNSGTSTDIILSLLQSNPPKDEDFEEWVYLFIVTRGDNDCPPS